VLLDDLSGSRALLVDLSGSRELLDDLSGSRVVLDDRSGSRVVLGVVLPLPLPPTLSPDMPAARSYAELPPPPPPRLEREVAP
jgi:hypothetical protein